MHQDIKQMTRYLLLLVLTFSNSINSQGQKLLDNYVSVDSLRSLQFRMLTDTTIEFSTKWRHMQPALKAVYKATETDTTIVVTSKQSTGTDTLENGIHIKLLDFQEKLVLLKINGGFLDYSNAIIYVRQKDFGENPKQAYIVDGKTYFQYNGKTNSYGLLTGKQRKNRQLQRKLKGLNTHNCSIEIFKGGFNTYTQFGIKYVYGVIVIKTYK